MATRRDCSSSPKIQFDILVLKVFFLCSCFRAQWDAVCVAFFCRCRASHDHWWFCWTDSTSLVPHTALTVSPGYPLLCLHTFECFCLLYSRATNTTSYTLSRLSWARGTINAISIETDKQ